MRLRIALAVALLCIAGAFALEMSGSARRLAGTNHIDPLGFVVVAPAGGRVCQPVALLPPGTGSVRALIGTYGRPLPAITTEFISPDEKVMTSGVLAGGGKQGYVDVPLHYSRRQGMPGTICLRFIGSHRVAIGGEPLAASTTSASVNGHPQPAGLALYYLRNKPESWWELLPIIVQRFGFGKAAFFGYWTLPAATLLLLLTWAAAMRLLVKEMA